MYDALDIALPEMFATLISSLHELFAALIVSCTNSFAILKIRELLVARRIDVLQYAQTYAAKKRIMRRLCGKKLYICSDYAIQKLELCGYDAANWRALKVRRCSRVKISACTKLLVSGYTRPR